MATMNNHRVTFIGDDAFISELKAFATQNPEQIDIEFERPEAEATRLGFDLATAVAIVAVIQGTLYVGELAVKVLAWLRKSKANKIVLQTPFKTIEIQKTDELTEDDVRKVLKTALTID